MSLIMNEEEFEVMEQAERQKHDVKILKNCIDCYSYISKKNCKECMNKSKWIED